MVAYGLEKILPSLIALDTTAGDIQALAAAATAGSTGKAADAGHAHPNTGVLANVASTGTAGYTLVNGTGNILTWTAPNDGQMHRVLILGEIKVISAQTGGAIVCTFTYPDASASPSASINTGGAGTGYHGLNNPTFLVAPGTTVTLQQSTAQTAGAAVGWFEIWAA